MSTSVGLSVAEAALRLGISKDALRRRIDRKSIKATKAGDGTWRIHLTEEPPPVDPTTDSTPDDTLRATTPATALLAEKDARIALLTDQLTIKDRQIQELHVMLQTAQRQLPASVPEPSAPHARPSEDESPLQNASAAPGVTGREIDPLLDKRRRSWWERLLGLG